MGITPSEMRRRLDRVGLIKNLIQDCYETVHLALVGDVTRMKI